MKVYLKIKNFYKRWNITYDEGRKFIDFKNRALSTIDDVLGELFLSDTNLEQTFLKLIAKHYPHSKSGPFQDINKFKEIVSQKKFENSAVYKVISGENNFVEFIKFLEVLFLLNLPSEVKDGLYFSLKEDIKLSLLDIQIKRIKKDNTIFYPKGAKLLDEKIVNDVLDWLVLYPKVQKSFKSALEKYQNKIFQRNLIDDLRLSLELLIGELLNNNKILANQEILLAEYLKQKNIPKELINMYWKLIDYYSKYQNNYVKHNDKVDSSEIEFILYLTGTFMRFLLTLGDR